MPLPRPGRDEPKAAWIERCMADETMVDEYETAGQRRAVCESQWTRQQRRGGGAVMAKDVAAAVNGHEAADEIVLKNYGGVAVTDADDATRELTFAITTFTVDREGEVVRPIGARWENYLGAGGQGGNPVVLWAHKALEMPVGCCVGLDKTQQEVLGRTRFAGREQANEFAETTYRMYRDKFLRAVSVGLLPITVSQDKMLPGQTGLSYVDWDLVEYSCVPIPANPKALLRMRKAFSLPSGATEKDLFEAIFVKPKTWLHVVRELAPSVPSRDVVKAVTRIPADEVAVVPAAKWVKRTTPADQDPPRWNRQVSKAFDAATAQLPPARLEYDWARQYLKCDLADIHESGTMVPTARVGAFLTALEIVLRGWTTDAVRRISEADTELPPAYETIRLTADRSQEFLVDATRFCRAPDGSRLVIRVRPSWAGLEVRTFVVHQLAEVGDKVLRDVWQESKAHNFLKGQAFSLGGEFLERGDLTWEDLFLEPDQLAPIQRAAGVLATKGAQAPARGILLMGPPGTGKTLSGRVLLAQVPAATFIWVAARDIYRAGIFGGLTYAFDLAAECAPAIVFIEDVDAAFDPSVFDLLKTELDGIKQRSGIMTILTTNYPERLPASLVDRPGRFHDVIQLDLPGPTVRQAMLAAWLPDLDAEGLEAAVAATAGLSGAHLRELAAFTNVIKAEFNFASSGEALVQALEKLQAQRATLDAARDKARWDGGMVRGSVMMDTLKLGVVGDGAVYRIVRGYETGGLVTKGEAPLPRLEITKLLPIARAGRVLSNKNLTKLAQAHGLSAQSCGLIAAVIEDEQSRRPGPQEQEEEETVETPAPDKPAAPDKPGKVAAILSETHRHVTRALASLGL